MTNITYTATVSIFYRPCVHAGNKDDHASKVPQMCPIVDTQMCPIVDTQMCPIVDTQMCPIVDTRTDHNIKDYATRELL